VTFLLDTNIISETRKSRPDAGVVAWIGSVEADRLHLSAVIGRVMLGVVLGAGLAGCAKVRGSGCEPDHPVVAPRSVKVGSVLTVTSLSHPCARATAPGGSHRLVLRQVGKADVDLGAVPIRPDGTYVTEVRIPAGARPGVAFVSVTGTLPVPCDDSGAASCVGYVTKVNLEAP
jgi:hypothetical protein